LRSTRVIVDWETRSLREVERDYPGWQVWPAVLGGLVYARRPQTSPPLVVRAVTHRRTTAGDRDRRSGAGIKVTATSSDGTLSDLLIQSVWPPRQDHTKGRRW
jgi:hypothetical protein